MPHPLLIGGLVLGGGLALWRIASRERHRLRHMIGRLATQQQGAASDGEEVPIPLERDPATGIYRPAERPVRKP